MQRHDEPRTTSIRVDRADLSSHGSQDIGPHPGARTSVDGRHSRNNLDFLRLIFAALVIVSHAYELIDGTRDRELLSRLTGGVISFGEFGLNGFFALSGYLIVASWVRNPHWKGYLRNRVLRIYPGFIVAFCVSVLIVGPLGWNGPSYFAQFHAGTFFASMLLLQNPVFVTSFVGQPFALVNAAMWSISYEVCCYVAVAGVGLLAAVRFRWLWIASTVVLLVVSCWLPEIALLPHLRPIPQVIRLAAIFFVGGSLYVVGFRGMRGRTRLAVLGAAFAASLFSFRYNAFGFATFGTPFLLSIGLTHHQWRPLRSLPDISYGTYLYGWPVQKLWHWYRPDFDAIELLGASLASALVCGYLSWACVEARFMKLKARSLSTNESST